MTVKELKNILSNLDEHADIHVIKSVPEVGGFNKINHYDVNQVMSVTAGINEAGIGESMVCLEIK